MPSTTSAPELGRIDHASRNAQEIAAFTFLQVRGEPGTSGEGNVTVMRGPDFTVVVDTGYPKDHDGLDVVAALDALDVDRVDLLVGTHPHLDHIGQLPEVITSFEVESVWLPGSHPFDVHNAQRHGPAYGAAVTALKDAGHTPVAPRAGDVYRFGSLQIEVLHPSELMTRHAQNADLNNDSLVLRATYGDVSVLLTGDALHDAEAEMMARGEVAADVLELGHHGAQDATSPEWLSSVSPQIAVASASGADEPHRPVVERLSDAKVDLYVTGLHGNVMVVTDGTDLRVVTSVTMPPFRSLEDLATARLAIGVDDSTLGGPSSP